MSDILPAIYSNPPAEAIARVIDTYYGLGEIATCRLLSRGNNDLFLVRLADRSRVVARLNHRRLKGPGNTAFETALLAHLKAEGAPVAAPIPARDGSLWRMLIAPEGEREFAVFEFMPGAPVSQTEGDYRLFGAALGAVHSAARGFDAAASFYRHDLESILLAPSARLAAVPHLTVKLRDEVTAVAGLAQQRVEPALAGLTWQVNHGDAAPVNCHIQGEGETRSAGLIDFEDAQPGWLAWEISHILFHLTRSTEPAAWPDDVLRRWSAFIEGMASVRPVPAHDLAAVVAFIPVRWLAWGAFFADRIDEWGMANLQPGWLAGQMVKTRRWLEAGPPPI